MQRSKMVAVAGGALAAIVGATGALHAQTTLSEAPGIRVALVNHAGIDIPASPDAVWHEIVKSYVDGAKFTAQGYQLTPLNDPAAWQGGYRMTLKDKTGKVVDDRIVHFTERDDKARRLSLHADYLSPSEHGLAVDASYQATPAPGGAHYQLDAYSSTNYPCPKDAKEEAALQKSVEDTQKESGAYLDKFLEGEKAAILAAGK